MQLASLHRQDPWSITPRRIFHTECELRYVAPSSCGPQPMFKVDSSARVEIPAELASLSEQEAIYRYVEILGHQPVWFLRLRLEDDADGRQWWKQILVADIRQACEILQLDIWLARSVYVLLPQHLSKSATPQLWKCLAVQQCFEPQSDDPCWRITTLGGTVLHSFYGTALCEERAGPMLWTDSDAGIRR